MHKDARPRLGGRRRAHGTASQRAHAGRAWTGVLSAPRVVAAILGWSDLRSMHRDELSDSPPCLDAISSFRCSGPSHFLLGFFLSPEKTKKVATPVLFVKTFLCHFGWSQSPDKFMAKLRVLQWNVLADGLAQTGDFVKKPRELLEWSSRWPVLLTTLLSSSPHIMCLQEVNHFDDFFLPQLQQHGYSGVFNEKPASPACEYGGPPDGCAIFFQAARFRLVEQDSFRFRNRSGSSQNQGGIICQLEDLEAQQRLTVATTHLKAKTGLHNEKRRLQQAEQLLQRLSDLRHKGGGQADTIICGDFNAPPTSDVYKLVHEHSLQLRSAYAAPVFHDHDTVIGQSTFVQCSGEGLLHGGASSEPPFTTWKFRSAGEKKETIDYIWYSSTGKVQPSRRLVLPSERDIGPDALPSSSMPSDHLPILCELVWIDQEQSGQPGPDRTPVR